MSEVYNIFSGERLGRSAPVTMSAKQLAKENDRFRKGFCWKTQLTASPGVKKLSRECLGELFQTLRRSKYARIDFGALGPDYLSAALKRRAHLDHSGGIIHAKADRRSIIWEIDSRRQLMKLSLAKEFGV